MKVKLDDEQASWQLTVQVVIRKCNFLFHKQLNDSLTDSDKVFKLSPDEIGIHTLGGKLRM